MAQMYYDKDADLSLLKDKIIGVMGYGSQGHAQAQNLRDSGLKVIIGSIPDELAAQAKRDGFQVMSIAEAAQAADIIVMLIPDQVQRQVYYSEVEQGLKPGKMLMFAHGFNIHYGQILPPPDVDVTMVAPKGPGHRLREVFVQGSGVPALVAVQQDATENARQVALAYAKGIGATRAGVLTTTFKEETETDLFGEQTVLCGGVSSLIKAAFETLVEAGYQPEVAYFECLHELKLITDLIYQGGLSYMRYSVSDTAEYGDYVSGPRVIDDCTKQAMMQILAEIQDGTFATRWILENQAGRPSFNIMRKREQEHQIEIVGKKLRAMMPWLKAK